MCGICGIAAPGALGVVVDEASLVRMRDTLTHRGPDGAGLFAAGGIGLGHRRLAIVDVEGGGQPIENEDGSVVVVFNGEIYNHREIRAGLVERGHRYRTESDTETIVHLYEERGAAVVDDLRGMFAFAIWDAPRRRLLLARDRLGIKPLYYTLEDGVLCFASEIKALLAAGAVSPALDYTALPEWAANRYTTGDATLFEGVKRLPPGHVLVWEDGRVDVRSYWSADIAEPEEPASDDEYVERFRELFRESVRLRLMADVPLGMFLSGGIDSSAIAAEMRALIGAPFHTFSVAFAEREANELGYARLVAESLGTEHHEIVVSPDEFFDALPDLVYHEDEPIAHPSSVPLYFVSRLAAERVKVVLTGEGSDELLAGYGKYRTTIFNARLGAAYRRLAPNAVHGAVARAVDRSAARSAIGRKLARTFLKVEPDLSSLYFDNFSVFSRERQLRLFTPEARERFTSTDPYRGSLEPMATAGGGLLGKLLAADLSTYLHELLMKQDQMSMAASIESRVPFLDHKLVEFAASLPSRAKLRGLTTKWILRKAMRGRLPDAILSRRKMGFPVPIGAWLRGRYRHLLDDYVLGARARGRGVFDQSYVAEIVARHDAGEDHSERLWMLVNFEIWQRRFVDGEETPAPAWRYSAVGLRERRAGNVGASVSPAV
jgi:asparagine synthase (glutamine-hydrolysing)